MLGDLDQHFGGNYLNEETMLQGCARRQGFSTAAIGKVGPTLIFDHTERTGEADHHRSTTRPAARPASRSRTT